MDAGDVCSPHPVPCPQKVFRRHLHTRARWIQASAGISYQPPIWLCITQTNYGLWLVSLTVPRPGETHPAPSQTQQKEHPVSYTWESATQNTVLVTRLKFSCPPTHDPLWLELFSFVTRLLLRGDKPKARRVEHEPRPAEIKWISVLELCCNWNEAASWVNGCSSLIKHLPPPQARKCGSRSAGSLRRQGGKKTCHTWNNHFK